MKPYYQDDTVSIYHGDCMDAMRNLPEQSVHCCVTSPPYYGLRDYGHDGQIGLEKTPEEYVSKLVNVYRDVRRVLRDDGTVWLNLGDSYSGGTTGRDDKLNGGGLYTGTQSGWTPEMTRQRPVPEGLKPKDLLGIPWRVAFALQADGWYLRQDIIWHKPNPMPESVTDRCTKSHEYVFLLTKSPRYWYDAKAVRQESTVQQGQAARFHRDGKNGGRYAQNTGGPNDANRHDDGARNRHSVWTISTRPYPGAHFAVFPPKLIEPCILAGCPANGTVLDPFMGSGTTAVVARKFGRKTIGCELNEEYIRLATKRLQQRMLALDWEEEVS